jgi:EAL domain-containing protein (putative c-di-GMP-specific phosphodiesterase class I)
VLFTLIRSLVDFGHKSGSAVVAEGVEVRDDAAALRAAGVDYAQGWYFGRPGQADQLDDQYDVGDLLVFTTPSIN